MVGSEWGIGGVESCLRYIWMPKRGNIASNISACVTFFPLWWGGTYRRNYIWERCLRRGRWLRKGDRRRLGRWRYRWRQGDSCGGFKRLAKVSVWWYDCGCVELSCSVCEIWLEGDALDAGLVSGLAWERAEVLHDLWLRIIRWFRIYSLRHLGMKYRGWTGSQDLKWGVVIWVHLPHAEHTWSDYRHDPMHARKTCPGKHKQACWCEDWPCNLYPAVGVSSAIDLGMSRQVKEICIPQLH